MRRAKIGAAENVPQTTAIMRIHPPKRPLKGGVAPPGSKSITNRALLLAALARGTSRLTGALKSDDTRHMAEALRAMGVTIDEPDATTFVVSGDGRLRPPAQPLFLGNAGTATRFLTAAVALVDGDVVVDGDAHMRKRPIKPLLEALASLGVQTDALTGCPPVTVHGQGTGGSNSGTIQTLTSFSIGGRAIPNISADFTQMKSGSFASWTEAGDLGLSVLSHFTPTFDYADETLYLEPLAHPLSILRNRSGLTFTKKEAKAIEVVAVRPNSAASAAGIAAGDRIVAVNGKDATEFSSADFLELVTAPAGTPLRLTVARGSSSRDVTLVLR